MPRHRKRTYHRQFAVALAVALAGSGVAFATLVGPGPVTTVGRPEVSAPQTSQPIPARTPSPSTATATPSATLITTPAATTPAATTPPPRSSTPARASTPATSRDRTRTTSPTPTRSRQSQTAGSIILAETNAARADAGLAALTEHACLATLAQRHAERVATDDRLYHQDLQLVLDQCGLSTAGENVAMNYTGPADMVEQWMDSPPHRENLLNSRFTLIGIGVAQARSGAWYGVQVFGGKS